MIVHFHSDSSTTTTSSSSSSSSSTSTTSTSTSTSTSTTSTSSSSTSYVVCIVLWMLRVKMKFHHQQHHKTMNQYCQHRYVKCMRHCRCPHFLHLFNNFHRSLCITNQHIRWSLLEKFHPNDNSFKRYHLVIC